MTNQLSFNDKTLTPIIQNNQTWLTSSDLANALGYKDTRSVTKIFSRYKDEFTTCMTLVVNLTTRADSLAHSKVLQENPPKETRIFSLRGCHLIAMFARTEQAKTFRQWVLDIIDKEIDITQQIEPKPQSYMTAFTQIRLLMIIENGQVTQSIPLKNDEALVSFKSPEVLQEMISLVMPGYVLVQKKKLLEALRV